MSELRKAFPVKLYDFQPDTWEEMQPPPGEQNKSKPNLKPTPAKTQYKPRSETITGEMKKKAQGGKAIPEDGVWRPDLEDALIVSSEAHRPNFQAFKKQYNQPPTPPNPPPQNLNIQNDPFDSTLKHHTANLLTHPITIDGKPLNPRRALHPALITTAQTPQTLNQKLNSTIMKATLNSQQLPKIPSQKLITVTKDSYNAQALNACNPNLRTHDVDKIIFEQEIAQKIMSGDFNPRVGKSMNNF